MLCQLCKKNPATVKISYMIADTKNEISICKQCADNKGIDNPANTLPQIFDNFLVEILGQQPINSSKTSKEKGCPICGTTWESFHQTGLFGCENCYSIFTKELDVLLRRIHGSNKHIGSRPQSLRSKIDASELKQMQMELQEAIKSEKFELAAELRDVIKDAQRELKKKENDGILR